MCCFLLEQEEEEKKRKRKLFGPYHYKKNKVGATDKKSLKFLSEQETIKKETNCHGHLFLPVSQIRQLGESPGPAVVGGDLLGK